MPKPMLTAANCMNPNEWGCSDGTCLPNEYFCDGSIDCPDESDEGYNKVEKTFIILNHFRFLNFVHK